MSLTDQTTAGVDGTPRTKFGLVHLQRRPRLVMGVGLVLALLSVGAYVIPACAYEGRAAGQGRPTQSRSRSVNAYGHHDSVSAVLRAQSLALLSGDEQGWLVDVDPATPAWITYKMLYQNLRGMQISKWDAAPAVIDQTASSAEKLQIVVKYCFVTPLCAATEDAQPSATMTITFVDGWDPRGFEGVLIEDIEMPKHRIFSGPGPLPWQVADLRAAVGSRVIVAAPVELTEWIPRALPLAEAAATVADRYLRWADLPGPYVIYLGRPGDLDNWFRGGSDPARELGIAFPVARYDIQVFIKIPDAADLTKGDGLRAIIQHELGHVVTLAGVEMDTDDSLIEGIAEYIGHAGQPISHIRDEDVRRYLRSGKWDGSIRLTEEISDQDMGVVNAAYGIGYLTMRRLVDRYGEAQAFGFFSDVERHHVDIDHSSWARFGAPWQTVNEDCVGYIRSVVRP